tara:strand:+ start:91 stop:504 length:414 start_codon:yes stop_codon:yes gene_type:complete
MEQMAEEVEAADLKGERKGYAKRKDLAGFGYEFSPNFVKPKGRGIFSYFSKPSKPPPPLGKNQHPKIDDIVTNAQNIKDLAKNEPPKIDEIVTKAQKIEDLAMGLKSQTGGKRNTRTRRRRHTKRRRPTKRRRTKRR